MKMMAVMAMKYRIVHWHSVLNVFVRFQFARISMRLVAMFREDRVVRSTHRIEARVLLAQCILTMDLIMAIYDIQNCFRKGISTL